MLACTRASPLGVDFQAEIAFFRTGFLLTPTDTANTINQANPLALQ